MQKLPEELNPQIEKLLLEKAYEELNSKEIILMEKHLSKSDYITFRQILLASKETFKQEHLSPDPSIKIHLGKMLDSRKPAPVFLMDSLKEILNYTIPVWKIGIASVVFIMGFYFYNLNNQWQTKKPWFNISPIANDSMVINQSRSVQADKELLNLLRGVQ